MSFPVKVRLPSGLLLDILVEDADEPVSLFKEKLAEIIGSDAHIRLIVDGKTLRDEEHIVTASKDRTVYAVKESCGGDPAAAAGSSAAGIASLNMDLEFADSPLNSLLTSMIEHNPDMLKSMVMANPQLKAMLERSPQLKEAMNNPEVLQDMFKLATNPQHYREAMRSADRAMSQLENIPQGFQMLRQLHEQVDASESIADVRAPSRVRDSSPAAALQTAPLPNPWAPVVSHPFGLLSKELTELASLGFTDKTRNLDVLRQTKGNVQQAIKVLLMDDESSDNHNSDHEQ